MRRLAVALLVLSGCGFERAFGPDIVAANLRRMDPPPAAYAALYRAVEECRGRQGDFGAVRWFIADSLWNEGDEAGGVRYGDTIVLRVDQATDPVVVRHEADHHVMDEGESLHLRDGGTACDGREF